MPLVKTSQNLYKQPPFFSGQPNILSVSLMLIGGLMDKKTVLEALKKLKEGSKKRNFVQSVDIIVNLKEIDLKIPEQQVDFFAVMHHPTGKKKKICALIGPELADEARKVCDKTILTDEFDSYSKDKKLAKKLASEHDFFIAQANIMPKIASAFGKVFGPKGKMPN